jgi:hypothetical protein
MRLRRLQEVSRHRTGCHNCKQLRLRVAQKYASDKSQTRCRAYSLLAFSISHLSMVKKLNNLARTWFPRVCVVVCLSPMIHKSCSGRGAWQSQCSLLARLLRDFYLSHTPYPQEQDLSSIGFTLIRSSSISSLFICQGNSTFPFTHII